MIKNLFFSINIAILLYGCYASSNNKYTAADVEETFSSIDGKPAYSIKCYFDEMYCVKAAASICQARGYDIIKKLHENNTSNSTFFIQCKQQSKTSSKIKVQ